MKIVQSFWSAPILHGRAGVTDNRLDGGWLDEKYHLMSWALSCLQLRKHYQQVELYTDVFGKEILIDRLGLPYTDVHLIFGELDNYDSQLWALGKILTYSKQKMPFLHVDGDVYIWQRFAKKIEEGDLIAQNVEIGFSFYTPLLNALIKEQFELPHSISSLRARGISPCAYNAGILGGNDLEFIQAYSKEALNFVNINHHRLSKINSGLFNTIYEQHLFYCMSKIENKKVCCQISIKDKLKMNAMLKGLEQFKQAPVGQKYIHLFGADAKKDPSICEALSQKLRKLWPEVFWRIEEMASIGIAERDV